MAVSIDPNGDDVGGGYTPEPRNGQGWSINATTDFITFFLPPGIGASNIVVYEYPSSAVGSGSAPASVSGGQAGTTRFAIGSWCAEYGYPSEIEFYSDRLWFAGTPRDPQMLWGTQTGDYSNFGRSNPIVDSDAVSFSINARQVNAVMDFVPLDKLIVLCKGGEFVMTGGQDEVITPSSIGIKPQSYRGTGGLQARVVGDTAIFVQEQGQRIYDIGYRLESDGFRPTEISVWADHLVKGRTILRMEYQPAPWSALWFVRDDGKMIGCTYMAEQEVIGWHRHDTGRGRDGLGLDEIEDVVALPGSAQTEVFIVVKRIVDGVEKRYIEQMAPVVVDDPRDWKYLDSCLTYDGRNTGATTVTLSGGSTWDEDEELTLTASAALFVGASDEDDGFTLTRSVVEANDAGEWAEVTYSVRLRILEYVSATVVTVRSVGDVPEELRGVAVSDFVFMRRTMTGLDHLEGRRVAILGDASVISNGRTGTAFVVTGGELTLPMPVGVAQIGLPFRAHIETLEVNAQGGEPVRDAKKLLTSVGVQVKDSRGISACGGTLTEENLLDLPQREFEDYGEPTQALTGYATIPLEAEWGENVGKVHLVSDEPLPMEVLAILPNVALSRPIR